MNLDVDLSRCLLLKDMPDKDVAKVKEKVAKLDGVKKALWVDDFVDLSVPKEILPKDMTDLLYNGDKSTMIIVMLKERYSNTNYSKYCTTN